MIILVILAVFSIWALFGLWGNHTYIKSLTPEERDLSKAIIATRRYSIIEEGRRKHRAWQENHRFLGKLYTYAPEKYFRDNRFNTKKYPY